jgi:hypothetical protein
MHSVKHYFPDAMPTEEQIGPFAPVHKLICDITRQQNVTVKDVVEMTVSVVLTTAANLAVGFKNTNPETDDPPTPARVAAVLCAQIMGAAAATDDKLRSAIGQGETRQ